MTCTESVMPCALIINTLADVLAKLLFEVVCIFLYIFLFHLTCVRKCLCFWPVPPADIARTWPHYHHRTRRCVRSSSLEYILNIYLLSHRNTGLIITCYLGVNLRKVSHIMGISRKNMQTNRSLCQYKDKKKEQVIEISLPL